MLIRYGVGNSVDHNYYNIGYNVDYGDNYNADNIVENNDDYGVNYYVNYNVIYLVHHIDGYKVDHIDVYNLDYNVNYNVDYNTLVQQIPAPNVYHVGSCNGGGAPAYSMSGRAREAVPPGALLPGPGTYEGTCLEAVNRRPPSYTMASRPKRMDDTQTPGPGNYSPEKVTNNFFVYGVVLSTDFFCHKAYLKYYNVTSVIC